MKFTILNVYSIFFFWYYKWFAKLCCPLLAYCWHDMCSTVYSWKLFLILWSVVSNYVLCFILILNYYLLLMLFLKVKCCSPSVVSFEFISSEGPIFERFCRTQSGRRCLKFFKNLYCLRFSSIILHCSFLRHALTWILDSFFSFFCHEH